jgi:hypothetical protein
MLNRAYIQLQIQLSRLLDEEDGGFVETGLLIVIALAALAVLLPGITNAMSTVVSRLSAAVGA